jgi:hypothetical protein
MENPVVLGKVPEPWTMHDCTSPSSEWHIIVVEVQSDLQDRETDKHTDNEEKER